MESAFTPYVQAESISSTHAPNSQRLSSSLHTDRIATQFHEVLEKGGSPFKQLLRRVPLPIHHSLRRHLWQRIICHTFDLNYSTFQSQHTGHLEQPCSPRVCPFIDSSVTPTFHLNHSGEQAIFHILFELEHEFSSLSYSPYLYPITALLLHYLSEREALEVLKLLVKSNTRPFITHSVKEWKQFTLCLVPLIRRYSKSLDVCLSTKMGHFTSWKEIYCWSLVFWKLPVEHLIRIMDCFLMEGEKVLFRAIIVILKVYFRQYKSSTENKVAPSLWDELGLFLPNFGQYCTSQELLDRMFHIRGFRRSRIAQFKAQVLESEDYQNFNNLLTHHHKGIQSTRVIAFTKRDPNPSTLLTFEELAAVMERMEDTIACLMRPVIIFSTGVDGTSLKTLFQKVGNHAFSLLVVETGKGEVLGAFCADSWNDRLAAKQSYFGRGLTFIFKLRPSIEFYHWVNRPEDRLMNLFMKGDLHGLYVGGSPEGAALYLDENLSRGSTHHSATFNNPPLVSDVYFSVKLVEIFGFVEA